MKSNPQKIQTVSPKIIAWFEKNQRQGLPWRSTKRHPYEVWVSEIMLQQTQVSRVIPFYKKFLKRFPTVTELARASWEEFVPYYQGLGYYSRGRNMLKAAQMIVKQYEGTFPREKSLLLGLPGIGEYTANAILSFAYDQSVLTFDTNHQRVWGRVLFGNKRAVLDKQLIQDQLPTKISSRKLNEALMDFANTICLNTKPLCNECPVNQYCEYFLSDGKKELKKERATAPFRSAAAQAWVILHKDNKLFYSPTQQFSPFKLPIGLNSRAQIKEYFQEKYNLTLSVRPPFKKQNVDGSPTFLVKAQVLLGTHNFPFFSLKEYAKWIKVV